MDILVIDIGGTFIKYAKMNTSMEIISRGKVKSPTSGREELVETIGKIYDSMDHVEGIAISTCGIIDPDRGYIVMGGGQMPFNTDFRFGEALYKRCPVLIYMENDAKCAAMAEASLGSLKDVSDGFVLLFGTMIGGGYIKDHKVYHGKHFSAGEVSYIFNGLSDYPTFDYIWGNECGIPNLCKMYATKKNLPLDSVDGIVFFEAMNNGDEDAKEILSDFTRKIAIQIFNLQTTMDPERFAIGGGISEQPIFIEYIKKHLDELYDNCVVPLPRAEVVQCTFKNDANLYGALSCFISKYL